MIISPFGWTLRKRFYEQAALQIDNKKSITDILQDFKARLSRRKKTKAAASVEQIHDRVRDGATLSDAMNDYLTDIERSLLSAGEKSGNISQAMKYIVETKDREARITGKVRSSLFAPSVYLLTLYLTLYVIGNYVVPQFSSIVPVAKWTGSAYVMYVCGSFASGYGTPVFLVSAGLLVFSLSKILPNWVSPRRDFFDRRIFPFTVYKESIGFAWLISFVSMIRSGMSDVKAVEEQIRTANPWLASHLATIHSALRDGKNLFEALNSIGGEFPSADLIEEIGAYVSFPDFSEKITLIVNEYAKTFERKLLLISSVTSVFFSGLMYFMFVLIQIGSNDLTSMVSSAMGG